MARPRCRVAGCRHCSQVEPRNRATGRVIVRRTGGNCHERDEQEQAGDEGFAERVFEKTVQRTDGSNAVDQLPDISETVIGNHTNALARAMPDAPRKNVAGKFGARVRACRFKSNRYALAPNTAITPTK